MVPTFLVLILLVSVIPYHVCFCISKCSCGTRPLIPPSIFRPSNQLRKQASSTLLLSSFISPDDKWSLWAISSIAAAVGLKLEKKTAIGKSLSGPVTAMLVTAFMTNIGILPTGGSIHLTALQSFVVKVATPLLLLGADLNVIVRDTGILLKAFCLGTIGTIIGSLISYLLLHTHLSGLGSDSWKIVAALTAKNIGGGLNFMSVASSLDVSGTTMATGLAVDNLLGLVYFPLISFLGRKIPSEASSISDGKDGNFIVAVNTDTNNSLDSENVTTALSIGLTISAISEYISINSNNMISPIPLSTLLAVIVGTCFPTALKPFIPSAERIGQVLLLLFFGSIGNSSGTIMSAIASTGSSALLAFGLILYVVHLLFITTAGRLMKIPLKDILIASNANIGNAATSSALASGKGWKSKVMPALLVGTLGNAVGTFIGLMLGQFILKPMSSI